MAPRMDTRRRTVSDAGGCGPAAAHLKDQAARPPARVGPAQLADQRLSLRHNLPRMLPGRVGPVSQAIKTLSPVPGHPAMNGLPDDAVSLGDFNHWSPGQDLQNRAVSLLDHVQLPKHERERHRSSGATVSHIKRSRAMESPDSCDNFLYGFKGAPSARRTGAARPSFAHSHAQRHRRPGFSRAWRKPVRPGRREAELMRGSCTAVGRQPGPLPLRWTAPGAGGCRACVPPHPPTAGQLAATRPSATVHTA
jgi:hypothetical protein